MAKFEDAIDATIENETGGKPNGGYTNDPKDMGGETKWGISKRSYPNLDIKNLTLDAAKGIYFHDFWKFGGITSQAVANKVFDMYVPAKHNAIKILQRLVGAADDGFYGLKTETAVNLEDPAQLLSRYRITMQQYYIEVARVHPEDARFLNGWLKRARQ